MLASRIYSPTGNAISRQFQLEIAAEKTDVEWELHRVKNFDEYRTLIHALNEDPKVRAIYPAAYRCKRRMANLHSP